MFNVITIETKNQYYMLEIQRILSGIIVVCYLSTNGTAQNLEWAVNFGGESFDNANSISVDGQGNVFTTGHFKGTSDFDPSNDVVNLTANGEDDIFVSKLDASGNFVWAKNLGGTSSDIANCITSDDLGNMYITGGFFNVGNFNTDTGTTNLSSAGDRDVFVVKMNSIVSSVDIESYKDIPHVNLYPNPTTGLINLNFDNLQNVKVFIYDTQGKRVYTEQNISSNFFQFNFNADKGIYFMDVISAEKKYQLKFIYQ